MNLKIANPTRGSLVHQPMTVCSTVSSNLNFRDYTLIRETTRHSRVSEDTFHLDEASLTLNKATSL